MVVKKLVQKTKGRMGAGGKNNTNNNYMGNGKK